MFHFGSAQDCRRQFAEPLQEAAAGRCSRSRSYTASAITCPWRSRHDFPRRIFLDDRFTSTNLDPALAQPGHKPSLATQSG
jgi:hypothetical protein